MKKKKISTYVLTIGLALGLLIPAFAENINTKVVVEASDVKSGVSEKTGSDSKKGSENEKIGISEKIKSDSKDNATTSDKEDKISKDDNEEATSTGSEIADEHKSVVSSFVHNLLSLAEKESEIGDKVREIAKEQNDSSSTTVEAINKVENKGGVSRFFFGSDYKNIGVIRSELSKTSNRIDELSKLASSTSIKVSDKEELNTQIEALKTEQSKLDTFVNTNESKFSLLGWFVKLFNK